MRGKVADRLEAFCRRAEQRLKHLHSRAANAAYNEIVFGGGITGAPGQPVDEAMLRNSWTIHFDGPRARITTNLPYARSIEDGFSYRWGKPMTLRSEVGGFHGVKLVRLNFGRILGAELEAMLAEEGVNVSAGRAFVELHRQRYIQTGK